MTDCFIDVGDINRAHQQKVGKAEVDMLYFLLFVNSTVFDSFVQVLPDLFNAERMVKYKAQKNKQEAELVLPEVMQVTGAVFNAKLDSNLMTFSYLRKYMTSWDILSWRNHAELDKNNGWLKTVNEDMKAAKDDQQYLPDQALLVAIRRTQLLASLELNSNGSRLSAEDKTFLGQARVAAATLEGFAKDRGIFRSIVHVASKPDSEGAADFRVDNTCYTFLGIRDFKIADLDGSMSFDLPSFVSLMAPYVSSSIIYTYMVSSLCQRIGASIFGRVRGLGQGGVRL
jgi:hypothetical protein